MDILQDEGSGGSLMFGGYGRIANAGGLANVVDEVAEETPAVLDIITSSEALRIENAATRIQKPITLVGSRANGTAKAFSDWDYVIENMTSKDWSKIKNSLPGARSIIDNTPRNIDIFKGPVNTQRPFIIFKPRP